VKPATKKTQTDNSKLVGELEKKTKTKTGIRHNLKIVSRLGTFIRKTSYG